ncbi:MAG: potassium channel family protein [Hyphomicrobiales bacterium]
MTSKKFNPWSFPIIGHFLMAVEKRRFRLLLGMLLLLLFTLPLLQQSTLGELLVKGMFVLILIGTVRAAEPDERSVLYIIILGIAWLILSFTYDVSPNKFIEAVQVAVILILGIMVFWYAVYDVALSDKADIDSLAAVVFGYFLLGTLWAFFYAQIEILAPGSFKLPGDGPVFVELTYFSFVTLTTLGYGDITATSAFARNCSALQAAMGVLYLAVFIARIITVYRSREND